MHRAAKHAAFLASALVASAPPAFAQQTLAPVRESGQTVTPVFEGWYRNPDGTFSLSFGYLNRNSREVVEIPVGDDNRIAPGNPNHGQPSRFEPRRHWGVFAVTVPADFGDQQKVTWTLNFRGQTYSIPGSLKRGWEIDALIGEADSGNQPPVLRFDSAGAAGSGPGGITGAPLAVAVGKALTVVVWAKDDGKASSSIASDGRQDMPVTLTWFKHQGPGDVTWSSATPAADSASGKATTTATFSAPGEYILRVRANDSSGLAGAGHAQCCWTNGFVKVTVTR
jgi:hypothetical protein